MCFLFSFVSLFWRKYFGQHLNPIISKGHLTKPFCYFFSLTMLYIYFFISRTMRNFCWERIFYWTSRKFFWDPRSGLTRQIFRIMRKYFTLFHPSFSKNRQKLLSAATESFLSVLWCSKLYRKFAWTLRNIFHMHNVLIKCAENFLPAENGA